MRQKQKKEASRSRADERRFSPEAFRFDRDLIQKYDRPGPRYTSYPTAPQFQDDFGPANYRELLAASRQCSLPLSLYVHIPFCHERCFFCGCNVTISRRQDRAHRYLKYLDDEMAMASRLLNAGQRETVQIHWGGGTPTFLPAAELTELMNSVRRHFSLSRDCEIGIEVDPRHCSPEQLDALAAAGVNRLSMGVQDFDPQVQEAVHRVQSLELTEAVLNGARGRGITSINIDLIYGLPHQSPETFAHTLEQVIRLDPDRLAVFNFAYLPKMFPHQRVLDPKSLPDPETKLTLLEESICTLTEVGYLLIGMDHFAKPEDSLSIALRNRTLTRNFQGYSTYGDTDLIAFGASAIGKVADGYAQNLKAEPAYDAAIEGGDFATCRGLVLGEEDRLRRKVILHLMGHFQLDKSAIEAEFNVDFDRHFSRELEALQPLAEDGLVTLRRERIDVTPTGRLLVRNVAMVFDAYLQSGSPTAFSRTI